jgi:primary-amine oxidase
MKLETSVSSSGYVALRDPKSASNRQVQIWRSGKGTGGDTLLPQGIYLRADITGRNSSNWSLTHILYGNELYPSIAAFREALRAPGFKKMKVNHGGDWINVESTGEEEGFALDDRAPPRQVSVGGQRFKVDEKERYVEWMDFSFFITYVYFSQSLRLS